MDAFPELPDAGVLYRRVSALIDAGRTATARPLLAAVRAMAPDHVPNVDLLGARLFLRDGDYPGALDQLNRALAQSPGDASLYKCRAEVYQRIHNAEAAARDAAEAVVLDRTDPDAKALLGNALLSLGRTRDAVVCLDAALACVPDAVAWREALATALEAQAEISAALVVLDDGIARAPANIGLRNVAMLIHLRQQDFPAAIALAEEARRLGIADACTFGMKGHAFASVGDHDQAALAYQEALQLGPHDPYVRHLVMAAGILPSATRAPPEYISAVFDGYAERFESHLIALRYTVPVRIRELLAEHPAIAVGAQLGPVLDLGCGTGLVALALSDLPIGPITGVDLSASMLEQARMKGLYDNLRQCDIMTDLTLQGPDRWALMLAADVLVYFGALHEVFAAIRAKLEPGGWFVFSLEDLGDAAGPWQLHRLGRYAHKPDYVQQALGDAGLRLLRCDRQQMRQEAGLPVPGLLIVAERARDDG